ncbi:CBS domain-containing protein [Streptomyces sp. LP05-1]|uniref:CBS domain-containing protein n=1 Tax=Streptomyces pyxinae TaxID=2970734 RepID=A0ABT2CHL0_9ACTN|nr:CBS domain-containing protein [Streptomyces sp. LP05-1]MCS0636893.1 CBS domain-containing protein [Streptomyces sp. LP05-1]
MALSAPPPSAQLPGAPRDRTVGEMMTREVVRVRPDTPAEEVAGLLAGHRITGVPVLDAEDRVVGVVSRTDVARGTAGPAGRARAVVARELMTSPAVTVHPEQRVRDAARVMERRRIDRLPVVDAEDRLIGITTRRDLLRVFLRTDEEIRDEVCAEVRAHAPGLRPGELTVAVRDGLVTLAGGGRAGRDATTLLRSLWRIDGVTGVVSTPGAGRPGP